MNMTGIRTPCIFRVINIVDLSASEIHQKHQLVIVCPGSLCFCCRATMLRK